MWILAWNCRGLACSSVVRALKGVIRDSDPDCLFLSETKIEEHRVKRILNSLGFSNIICVDPIGQVGGISLSWKQGVIADLVCASVNMISVIIFSDPPHKPWMLTGIYGPPYNSQKPAFWDSLEKVLSTFSGPWIGLGDYNYLLSNADKKGGVFFASSSSSSMRNRVDALGLIDMGFIGNLYTWTNKRPAKANVKERLDRALANTDWRIFFPNAKVKHFPIIKSYHALILLLTQGDLNSYPKPFKFEAAWTRDSTSNKVISLAWNQPLLGSLAFKLSTKLKEVKKKLKEWNQETFGNIHYKLNQVKS
jgi:hypothetical protein